MWGSQPKMSRILLYTAEFPHCGSMEVEEGRRAFCDNFGSDSGTRTKNDGCAVLAQLGIGYHAAQQLPSHAAGQIQLTGLQASHARRQIPEAPHHNGLGSRGPAPVLLPGLKDHLHPCFLADEFKGTGTDGTGFEPVLPHLLVVVLGENPANAGGDAKEKGAPTPLPHNEEDGPNAPSAPIPGAMRQPIRIVPALFQYLIGMCGPQTPLE